MFGRLIDIEGQSRLRGQPFVFVGSRNAGYETRRASRFLRPDKPEPDTEADLIRDVASVVNTIAQMPLRNAMPKATTDAAGTFPA